MARKATKGGPRPAQQMDRHAKLEECRVRLESVELLLASSPRDALLLARALLDDVVMLLAALYLPTEAQGKVDAAAVMPVIPDAARVHLASAHRWLGDAEAAGGVVPEAVVALRRAVADLARGVGRTDVTGVATFAQALRHTTWLQAGIATAVVLAVLVGIMEMSGRRDRSAAEFERWFAEGSARLTAGDHAGVVERLQKAVSAMPGKDRTASAWNDLGWSLQQLGRHEEAVTAYRKALELRPAFSLARNNLAAVQRQIDLKKAEKMRQAAPTGK